jgi:TonB family protein
MTPTAPSLFANRYLVLTGWTLLVVLWETAAVAVVLAAFRAWTHARRPAQDYAAALVAFVAAFAIAAVMPLVLTRHTAPMTQSFPLIGSAGEISLAIAGLNIVSLRTLLQRPLIDGFAAAAALVWAGGTLVLAVRFAGGWLIARSIAAAARPIDDPALESMILELVRCGGVTRAIRLLESPAIDTPVVVGWHDPRLLVPPATFLRLSRQQLAGVIAHEVAHIRRGDYVINLLHSVAEVPLFFSPAVAWMSRCIRDAREFCCDDEAAARVGDKRHYVEALTHLAAGPTTSRMRAAVGITGPRLVTRVRRLLQEDTMPRLGRFRLMALGTAFVLIVLSGLQLSAASTLRFSPQSDTSVHKTTDPGVKAPVLVHEVKPVYTDDAKERRVQGSVELEAVITSDGTVRHDVRVVKSLDPDLDAQAVTAAKQWQFKPGTKHGKPVDVLVNIEMTFTLK